MLNDIMSNNNIVVSNNEQFSYAIQKASEKKENYIISYNNIDIDNSFYSIKALYSNKERNWLNNDNISLEEYENNILRYNNYKNLVQDTAYIKYDNTINDNSLIIDNSYNSLYYVQPDKINLLSYSLNTKNGFNYNENNHTLYFNVDNKYIKSINNLLYYNYNNIRNTSPDNIGVSSTDDNYFNVKNNNNSYSNNTLTIIKEFKTEIFSTLNKIKNLYKECEVIYDTLTYFNKVNNNREPLSLNGGVDNNVSYNSREIKFENPKLYYTNYEIGIDSLDLSGVDTLYLFDLNNAEFNIGYNNVKNYDYLSNEVIFNTTYNVNSLNKDLLKNRMSLTLAENEATADISYNHYYKTINGDKYPIGTTYNININNINENIFDDGISILYNSSPYINIDHYSYLNDYNQIAYSYIQTITLPYKKELNIRKIAGSFKRYFYTTQIAKDEANNVEYLFVSSHYETKPFCVPKNSFDYLKSNNTITDCFNLQYFSSYKPGYNYDEVNPVLNIYPNNYINDKYFDSDLILYLNLEDDTNDIIRYTQISDVNQIITNEDELSTCVSKIRDVYLNSVKCLYFYKLRYNEEGRYYETIGDPNMLIFEEDIDNYLTFIARNNLKYTFTTNNEIIAKKLEYSLDGVTWHKFHNKTKEDDEYYITEDSGVYTCITGRIENSNKILWKLDLNSLLPKTQDEDENSEISDYLNSVYSNEDENSEILDYLNSGYGIGIFGSIYDGTSTTENKIIPKFEIFGNSMSLIYGEKFKEPKTDKNGEEINEYKTKLINKPNVFKGLFSNSAIISARRLALPALTLTQSNYCYAEMFNGCELLGDCPSLPATTLSDRCYKGMFKGCKALRSAPRLDAKIMRAECYKEMFMNCENLIILPNVTKKYPTGILPSTELNYGCYESMFRGCTDLNVMPQLVASIMKQNCYKQMFMGCTSISKATNMPAIQEFAKSCFYFMFHSTHIVPNIITTGVNINICQNLYFNATNDSYEHKIFVHNVQIGALQGLFGGTDIKYSELSKFLPLNSENYAYLNTYLNDSYNNLEAECYLDMFSDSAIDMAPALPATEMKMGCYKQMFYNCSNLEEITKINVETTAKECCMSMFEKCISLTNVPILSAETLSERCYKKMFMGCEKLQVAPELPAKDLVNQCYDHMFTDCKNLIFIKALFLTAPIKDENNQEHFDIINNKQCAWYTDDWIKGVMNFDKNNNELIDTFEDYNEKYSNKSQIQISFTDNLINAIKNRADDDNDHILDNDYIDVNNQNIKGGLGLFIRNTDASWIVKENIGNDGIPKYWVVYSSNNKEYPIFVFFHSNSHRNYEDYSKLIYGFPGDVYNGIPIYNVQNPENGDFYRRGHTFKGWSLNSEALNDEQSTIVSMQNIIFDTTDKTYFAVWEANEYDIIWHYPVDYNNDHTITKEYTETTSGDYETLVSRYTPQLLDNTILSDYSNPVPTHQYPRNDQNELRDGYIFWGWSSLSNPIEQLAYVNPDTITNYFIRTIDNPGPGNDLDLDTTEPNNTFETDRVGLNGENDFYAVWKYIVKWNINTNYNEGYYTSNTNNITEDYYYQDNYLYNDNLVFPNSDQEPNNNNKYRFGGWATYQGPEVNNPYIPDMYTDNIQTIYNSIKNGVDVIPTHQKSYKVTEPKNFYATWRYEIIWYTGYNSNYYTVYRTNYGYYNDKAENYRPTDPDISDCTFVGWNSEPNQRTKIDLSTIVIHNSGLNNFYPVWKYHVYWYTRSDNVSSHGHYNSDQIDNDNYFENHYEYKEYLYGDTLTLPTKNPTRNDEDYIFDCDGYDVNIWAGWATYQGPNENEVWKPNIPKSHQINDPDMFYAVYKPAITWYYFDNNSYTSTYGYKHNYFSNNSIKTYGYYNENVLSPTISDTKPTNPSIERYIFVGWNTSANQTTSLTTIKITNPGSNKIYAVWKYSIKWNTYNGSYSTTGNGYYTNYYYQDNYLYNSSLIYPSTNPTRSHYEFGGWATYQGPSGSNVWSSDISNSYKVKDSVDFYAVWKPAVYWYNYDGSSLLYTTYGNYNAYISTCKPSQTPSREGYTFRGWNTAKNKTEDNTYDKIVKDYSNNVFYAAYTVDTYLIKFVYTNYSINMSNTREVAYGQEIGTLPTGTRTGYYDATQWTYSDNTTVSSTDLMPADNITLTIVPTSKKSYTITFEYGDYTGTELSRSVTFEEQIGTLPTGTRDGYDPSERWKYNNGTEAYSTDLMPADNITLTIMPSDVIIYVVKFILTGSVYNRIRNTNDEETTSIFVGIPSGNTLGTLPTAIDTNGTYNESQRWKNQDTDQEVFSNTLVEGPMTLVPIEESMSIEPFAIIYSRDQSNSYGGAIKFKNYNVGDVEYSTDGSNWNSVDVDNNGILKYTYPNSYDFIENNLYYKTKVYFRAKYVSESRIDFYVTTYDINKEFYEICGDILSLHYTDTNFDTIDTDSSHTFSNLFKNNNPGTDIHYLKYAGDLILPNYVYSYMYDSTFYGCNSLVTAPTLRATTLASGCYYYMFIHCYLLNNINIESPITTLANNCYNRMFDNCKSLTSIPTDLFPIQITTAPTFCYLGMFNGCESLTSVPSDLLPATILNDNCYEYMFAGCTSLTTVPRLPATTLADYCYDHMFAGCTSLTSIPSNLLPATTCKIQCYYYMFYGCTSLENVPELPATILAANCYSNMFNGCTSLNSNTLITLPATTLTNYCYQKMFAYSTISNIIVYTENVTEITLGNEVSTAEPRTCFNGWLSGVTITGTLKVPNNMVETWKQARQNNSIYSDSYPIVPLNWNIIAI